VKGDITAKLDEIGIDAICDMIVEGKPYTEIAQLAGGSKASFIRWLALDADRSARAREARSLSAATFDEMAEAEIRQASDPFELARAKELAHHYRWRSAKRNPAEFSEKLQQELTGKDGGPVQIVATDHDEAL